MSKEQCLDRINEELGVAARIPYNTATAFYHHAGLKPDRRFGGSCIDKITAFCTATPEVPTVYIATQEGQSVRHYAVVANIGGEYFYCDPYQWQDKALLIAGDDKTTCTTTTWVPHMRIQLDSIDRGNGLPTISLYATRKGANQLQEVVLSTYVFTNVLPDLPTKLAVKIGVPNYAMHVVDLYCLTLYKIGFDKKNSSIRDIWVSTAAGERWKVGQDAEPSIRLGAYQAIERSLDATISELTSFFVMAYQIEQSMGDALGTARLPIQQDEH